MSLVRNCKKHSTRSARLQVETLEDRCVPSSGVRITGVPHTTFSVTNLVSDQQGVAQITDPNLVNGWGIAVNPQGAFWVSSNGKDLSTLYVGDVNGSPISKFPLEVNIPGGAPTGQVFNGTGEFQVSAGGVSGSAVFIFAAESGIVSGWNPNVPAFLSQDAQIGYQAMDGAIYKGIALGNNGSGNFLYVADFHNNKIDVLDSNFTLTHLDGSFTDPKLPKGYAPFNVAALNGQLYVAYAKQDADAEDEVAGPGRGFVDVFDLNGHFEQRLISRGKLNAPWAMIIAPDGFGQFSGDLLVGNFGNGRINAYNPNTGHFLGTLSTSPGHPIVIDGLWGLAFGNGVAAGSTTTLYFAAGPEEESHGLFGKIEVNAPQTSTVHSRKTHASPIDVAAIIAAHRHDGAVHGSALSAALQQLMAEWTTM